MGPGCLHWPPKLWRLPLCAAVARGAWLQFRTARGLSLEPPCAEVAGGGGGGGGVVSGLVSRRTQVPHNCCPR